MGERERHRKDSPDWFKANINAEREIEGRAALGLPALHELNANEGGRFSGGLNSESDVSGSPLGVMNWGRKGGSQTPLIPHPVWGEEGWW